MMWPETSTTSVALMDPRGYSRRAYRPRVFGRNYRDPGDRGLVDPHGGDRLEAQLSVVPQVPDDHLDDTGPRDGQQGADESGQLHPDEYGQQDEQGVQLDGPAH